MKLFFKSFTLFVLYVTTTVMVYAQTISPAMMAQFQSLPKAQQEALAKQYGVDLDSIMGGTNSRSGSSSLGQPGEPLEQYPFTAEMTDEQKAAFYKKQEALLDKQSDDELERYGLALFNRNISTFAPTDNASIPKDYQLGIGDELVVQMFGKENQSTEVLINREGEILLPKIGPIKVSGLSYEEATRLIQNRIRSQLIGVDSVVSLGQIRAINVFMAGEVKIPGAYSVSGLSTVSQVLFQSGGVTDIGSLRNIQLKRGHKTVAVFDLYDLLLNGDASNDIRLYSGDVVFVPPFDRLVTVDGEVKRPMLYEASENDNVASVLKMAGGLKSSALKSKLIHIQNPQGSGLPEVNNISLSNKSHMSRQIKDGDKLIVLPVSDALENVVSVQGAVSRPGDYGWTAGSRVSDIISDLRRDLLHNVDLNYALIIREKSSQLDLEIIQFKPIDIFTAPGSDSDPQLNANDELLFFSYVEIADEDDSSLEEDLERKKQEREYETLLQSSMLNRQNDDSGNYTQNQNVDDSNNEFDENNSQLENYLATLEKEAQEKKAQHNREVVLEPVLKKLKSIASQSQALRVVSVSGAVKMPGEYPLSNDGTIQDLIIAAGGLSDSAFIHSVELRRVVKDPTGEVKAQYLDFDLATSKGLNTKLVSKDHLNIRMNDDWDRTDSIELAGQVKFPGVYLIQPGETLSDVIQRAGGLKQDAFPEAAVFTRLSIAKIEKDRAEEFADSLRRDFASSLLTEESVNSNYEEVALITQKLEMFEGQGRLLIDLPSALNGDVASDIELTDGDTLTIPKRSNTVTVVGEVRRQGTHTFQTGFGVDEYLALGAGTTSRADNNAIYIVRANGSVVIPETSLTMFTNNIQNIRPGDTIIVPVDNQYKESISFWRDITQIVYQGTVAIAAIARL